MTLVISRLSQDEQGGFVEAVCDACGFKAFTDNRIALARMASAHDDCEGGHES